MALQRMSQSYHLRKRYLESDQVPSQSVIKKVMSPALASIYFKSMSPKTKIIVGLEPPLKGGGNNWYIPPETLLDGKVVMKPFKKELIAKLNHNGVYEIGQRLYTIHHNKQISKEEHIIHRYNASWATETELRYHQFWMEFSEREKMSNTMSILNTYEHFSVAFVTSLDKIQDLMFNDTKNYFERNRKEAHQVMQKHYDFLLRRQTIMLNKIHQENLLNEKARLKNEFMHRLTAIREKITDKLHDINLEKHTAIEKMRQYVEMKNVACQVYVALKEREHATQKEGSSESRYEKIKTSISENIKALDSEIQIAIRKENQRKELNTTWQQKVCQIVKHFQMFVSYSLRMLPEQADFFMNIEKLMLLQLSQVLEEPEAESIIIMDEETFNSPVPKPHPFYLFCDKGYKPKIDQERCPKHCTSSASQLPVIVIDKRCIYSACDNFQQITDKIEDYVHGNCKEDAVLKDYHDYSLDVPVKCTSSQQLKELQLESSLLQLLQKEIINSRAVPIECDTCRIPHCFGCDSSAPVSSQSSLDSNIKTIKPSTTADIIRTENKISSREAELQYEREPKWESYSRYVEPKKCDCAKRVKKNLLQHLPIYMRKTSTFDTPELLNYEKCSVAALKSLVNKAGSKKMVPIPPKVLLKSKEMGTQYSDEEFDYICACLSDESVKYLCDKYKNRQMKSDSLSIDNQFRIVDGSLSPSYLLNATQDFAADRALSLKRLIDQSPEIKNIFEKKHCDTD